MIKVENVAVLGWEHAIRGMRNPMNSWDKSDSEFNVECNICDNEHYDCDDCPTNLFSANGCDNTLIGPKDLNLMMRLAKGGMVEAKYRRMIVVYADITAPLYFWKEYDTYKVGTVANSCSTMHKIHAKEFTLEDFSCEHLIEHNEVKKDEIFSTGLLKSIIDVLNFYRLKYFETQDKKYWWQLIQLLPSGYNQKRTVMLNYEVLSNIYKSRKNHKLDEWRTFCGEFIRKLPYSDIITLSK